MAEATAGLTPEQVTALKKAPNRDAAIAEMTAIQDRQRAELKAAGIDVSTITPEVGVEISWTQIVRHVFRVLQFDPTDMVVENDQVRAASTNKPYGYLLVESPILNQPIRLPIVNSDDFRLATSVYEVESLRSYANGPAGELLVTYAPKDKLPGDAVGFTHGLHFLLTPRGTLERYYPNSPVGDRRMARPEPETLFGPFVYTGQMAVKVNQQPAI